MRFEMFWGIWLWVGQICNVSAVADKGNAGHDWKESSSHPIQRPEKFGKGRKQTTPSPDSREDPRSVGNKGWCGLRG